MGHARLFLGPEGSGHLPLALALSTYMHCRKRGDEDACGACPSCLKMKKLEHPDVHYFFPAAATQEHKKDPMSHLFYPVWRSLIMQRPYFTYTEWLEALGIENKQAIINASDCNEIIRLLGLKPYESPYRIVVIYMIEKLYYAAAPRLLKILEEPPDNTYFLMISENRHLIINTILSRLQILTLPGPDKRSIESMLSGRYGISSVEAGRMAALSEGNVCDAIKMAETDADIYEHFEQFRSWMRLCYKGEVQPVLNWVDATSKLGREKQKSFLAYGLRVFRLCLAKNHDAARLLNIQGGENSFVEGLAPFIHQDNILQIADMFNEAIYHIERNANPKILLADLSFQLSKLLKPF